MEQSLRAAMFALLSPCFAFKSRRAFMSSRLRHVRGVDLNAVDLRACQLMAGCLPLKSCCLFEPVPALSPSSLAGRLPCCEPTTHTRCCSRIDTAPPI
eukprot:3559408-Amphidinium_carterae.1